MTTMNREEQKQVLIDTANHVINRDNTSPYSEILGNWHELHWHHWQQYRMNEQPMNYLWRSVSGNL